MSEKSVWIVIPAYNEASALRTLVTRLTDVYPLFNVVVVDDCSTDRTAESLEGLKVHVCRHPINLGQGAALQTGIEYALKQGADLLVTFDADGQHQPESIAKGLKAIEESKIDIVLGSRFLEGGSAENIPARRKLMLRLAVAWTRISTKLKITDTHNGFRVLTAAAARAISITQNRMAHASQILSQIAELHLKYAEIPVRIVYTDYSLKKGQKISNLVNILWDSLTESLRR